MTTTTERIRRPYVLAGALAGVLALTFFLWPVVATRLSDAYAEDLPTATQPTAAQARPAVKLVASLPPVAGSTRDPYDTACGMSTPYCVTSPSLSARQLALDVRRLLVARGAKIAGRLSCDVDAILAGCTSEVAFRGVTISVGSVGRRTLDGLSRPAAAYVVVVTENFEADPPSRPLGAWATLGLFPAAWGTPRCTAPVAGGCRHYAGTLVIRAPLSQARRSIESRLASWGLAVDEARCEMYASGAGCLFAGKKFRTLGGQDPVIVVLTAHADREGATSLRILVGT